MGPVGRRPEGGTALAVAERLRALLLDGELVAGQKVTEESIRSDLGVSRASVREAFRLLTNEGLFVHVPDRGVFVRELTPADMADNYRARAILERAALEMVDDIPAEVLERLAAILAEANEANERDDRVTVARMNIAFHKEVVMMAGSPWLNRMHKAVQAEFRLAYVNIDDGPDFRTHWIWENQRLYEALRDLPRAQAILYFEGYLQRARVMFFEAWKARNGE